MKSKKLFLTFKSWLAPNSILFLYPVWSLFLRAISNFKAGKKKEKKSFIGLQEKNLDHSLLYWTLNICNKSTKKH
jgi:hypothetical protein